MCMAAAPSLELPQAVVEELESCTLRSELLGRRAVRGFQRHSWTHDESRHCAKLRESWTIKEHKARAFGGSDGAAQGGPLKTGGDNIMGAAGGASGTSDGGGVGDVKRSGGPS